MNSYAVLVKVWFHLPLTHHYYVLPSKVVPELYGTPPGRQVPPLTGASAFSAPGMAFMMKSEFHRVHWFQQSDTQRKEHTYLFRVFLLTVWLL